MAKYKLVFLGVSHPRAAPSPRATRASASPDRTRATVYSSPNPPPAASPGAHSASSADLVSPYPPHSSTQHRQDQSVGKTSIISRFMYDKFDNSYQATIGIDFLSKAMYLEDAPVRLQLWDTAGQERFRSLIPSYLGDSSVAVVVYDVSIGARSPTRAGGSTRFEPNGKRRHRRARREQDRFDRQKEVSVEEGDARAREAGVMFIETSASWVQRQGAVQEDRRRVAGMEAPAAPARWRIDSWT